MAGQLFRRLQNEGKFSASLCSRFAYNGSGFIALETVEQDELGMMETRSTRSKNKKSSRTRSRRKNTRGQRYAFIRSMINTQKYRDYFSPTPEIEKRVLGLDDLVSRMLKEVW